MVMPALTDAHVHLIGSRNADPGKRLLEPSKLRTIRTVPDVKTLLEWGFTAVRDLEAQTEYTSREQLKRLQFLGLG